ncbi:MAG TPA: hypothetical protein VNA69_14940 [Thermoanaerobaculia bacterium]|nr:hypothetical protein [Thermoanaerobaculia bacterium]
MKKKLIYLIAFTLTLPLFAQQQQLRRLNFASDFQTVPVMANTTGIGGAEFQSYVALLNPTSSAFTVDVTLFDANGTERDATISLAAGEQKTYTNFLEDVFGFEGGGAVTFRSADGAKRFVISTQVTTGNYSTQVDVLEFPGSNSRSFAAGVTVDSTSRTNIGCFNQSDAQNAVTAKILDKSGQLTLGTINLSLPANAWAQTSVGTVVSDGVVQFDPSEAAVCYAVVVNNLTNDGRYVSAAEYTP